MLNFCIDSMTNSVQLSLHTAPLPRNATRVAAFRVFINPSYSFQLQQPHPPPRPLYNHQQHWSWRSTAQPGHRSSAPYTHQTPIPRHSDDSHHHPERPDHKKKRTHRPHNITMPPRKSTSSVTPAEPEEPSQLSPQAQSTADKPITATEQQIKARAEQGVSVDVSRPYPSPTLSKSVSKRQDRDFSRKDQRLTRWPPFFVQ